MLHIIDGQDGRKLDVLPFDYVIDDDHHKSLENTLETYYFKTFADKRFSPYLSKRNRVLVPDEDGTYVEFIIFETDKYHNQDGHLSEVYASASYINLRNAEPIRPQSFTSMPAAQMVTKATNKTIWKMGIIEGKGTRTISIEKHTNPYALLKRIATEFDLELRFRAEHNEQGITDRYVDLLERVGEARGRTAQFGVDLQGIRRIENTEDVVTALVGIGPERDDGTRIEVIVTDDEALQRWGENGEHIWDTHEVQTSDLDITMEDVRRYTRAALDKRIKSSVKYETTIVDLEHVPGLENKKIRFGDTIKIKDTKFNPPLYLEARVFDQHRSAKLKGNKKVILGDYVEYTQEEVDAIWNLLKKQMREKISAAEMLEYTYDKLTIDDKDEFVFTDGKTFAQLKADEAQAAAEAVAIAEANLAETQAKAHADNKVSAEEARAIQDAKDKLAEAKADALAKANAAESAAKTHADTQANIAETNSKDHADIVSGQALIDAKNYAVAQQVYDNKMTEIATDLANKTDIEYVDGQLVSKANKNDVYTISEVDNRLLNYVGVIEYQTDIDGIVQNISSNSTLIGQNQTAIALKADQTEVNTLSGTVSDNSAQLSVQANQISSKVDASYVDGAIAGFVGRNLLIGTKDFVDSLNNKVTHNGVVYSLYGYNWGFLFNMNLKKGETYTVSVPVFNPSETDTSKARIWVGHLGNMYTNLQPLEARKVKHTFTATQDEDNAIIRFLTADGNVPTVGWIYPKTEKGNKATDWTPAPEDTQADIDFVYNYAESEITQLAGRVDTKAESTVVDNLGVRVTTAEQSINALDGAISQKVSQTDYNGNTITSMINQSATTIDIQANRINFDGHVFGTNATFSGEINVEGKVITDPNVQYTNYISDLTVNGMGFSASLYNGVYGNDFGFAPGRVYADNQGGTSFGGFDIYNAGNKTTIASLHDKDLILGIKPDGKNSVFNDLLTLKASTGNVEAKNNLYMGGAIVATRSWATANLANKNHNHDNRYSRVVGSTDIWFEKTSSGNLNVYYNGAYAGTIAV
ncbi:phage tail spike protein [Paraliobacillus salinarum]|uniref:phage tail spike protein n=1 Tax=Paraliobacillus salinarum TaxID=1158996 RepID=UPI0015F5C3FC|nr:phage tail spike protein [Paraliobacillus salinarum]